jgi:formylglycine-generating enzyme required for sulfatase activity
MRPYCYLVLFILSYKASAQVLLPSVPEIMKHVPSDSAYSFYPSIKYIFPELQDSSSLNHLLNKAGSFNSYQSKAPLSIEGFTFFNDNLRKTMLNKNLLKNGSYNFFRIFFTGKYDDSTIYPPSLRFYANTNNIMVNSLDGTITVNEKPVLDRYIEPFYFKNYEVTNHEYREFVHWVIDSIGRQLLVFSGFKEYAIYPDKNDSSIYRLNWKKKIEWDSDDEEYRFALEDLYLPERERFYRRKEIDTRRINYTYYPTEEEKNNGNSYKKEVIAIWPDTLRWIYDFVYSFNEPMTNNYFWHPAYDYYPVVGLTYEQATAYLDWKTKRMQQDLDNKKIKYKVVCKLPSDIEWEIAGSASINSDTIHTYTSNSQYLWDDSWLTDLKFLSRNGGTDTMALPTEKRGYVIRNSWIMTDELLLKDERFRGKFYADGYFHTSEANLNIIEKKRKTHQLMLNLDPIGISGMGGNVSEWMDNVKDESWAVLFRKRQQLLQHSIFPEAKLVSSIETLYYNFTYDPSHSNYDKNFKPNNARLVRGGSWFDERFSYKYGKNVAGMNAKSFVEDTGMVTRCTIGFRYIIKVYPK